MAAPFRTSRDGRQAARNGSDWHRFVGVVLPAAIPAILIRTRRFEYDSGRCADTGCTSSRQEHRSGWTPYVCGAVTILLAQRWKHERSLDLHRAPCQWSFCWRAIASSCICVCWALIATGKDKDQAGKAAGQEDGDMVLMCCCHCFPVLRKNSGLGRRPNIRRTGQKLSSYGAHTGEPGRS